MQTHNIWSVQIVMEVIMGENGQGLTSKKFASKVLQEEVLLLEGQDSVPVHFCRLMPFTWERQDKDITAVRVSSSPDRNWAPIIPVKC